jgi:exodeoxyribonuclease VII large subunit
MRADTIRTVGLGELLARLERRRQLLAAEGLFVPERKRRLPFLPRCVGLVTGAGSAAERDVLENARHRWPAVGFAVRHTAVQGPDAAAQIIQAVQALDRDPQVEVIVVARGGGSVEDLLPFSDEGLLRAVAAARTPVVSAIGHDQDTPLLDLVADLRASTPTDAAKRVVPDVAEETERVALLRDRARRVLGGWLDHERQALARIRERPCLADPGSGLAERSTRVIELRGRASVCLRHRLDRAQDDLVHQLARVRSLSPLATLRRGYAVVQTPTGEVVSSSQQVTVGGSLVVRLADGRLETDVTAVHPEEEGT